VDTIESTVTLTDDVPAPVMLDVTESVAEMLC